MNVVTALNRKYIPYTVIMLSSLGMNSTGPVDAYLLHSELTDEDIKEIQDNLSQYGIKVHSVLVDKGKFSSRLPRNDQWSIEMYYRLLLLELLPAEVDRAIYLDGDIIVNKPLNELYEADFEDDEILVCDDKCGLNQPESYGDKHREMFAKAYEAGFRYFNSGVMLLNIALLRQRYSFQTYLDAIKAWDYQMEAPDQDILNWVHWRNVGYVDCMVYDLFARVAHNAQISYEEVKENVAIVHYAGTKPWNNDNVHYDIERIWWNYAKKTPYYEELLKKFVASAMTDTTVETYIRKLAEENSNMRKSLDEAMKKVQKLTT